MGKRERNIKKKRKEGEAKKFMKRTHALRKLQISLKDFRRLCILKGIYPRVPRNKKKLNHGSTQLTTWYYRRDIQYLLHEPLVQKLRDWKVYARKLSKLKAKQEWALVENLKENEPIFNINHIIRERYPIFTDALGDLDDALSMICLFSTLPQVKRVMPSHFLLDCQRKRNDFFRYVAQTHCLKKAFVSIKGIYLQAEIHHQLITWVMPHPFSLQIPKEVDLRIMSTFSQLYESLLGFVLFKLYKDQQWSYPPSAMNQEKSVWPCILDMPAWNHSQSNSDHVETEGPRNSLTSTEELEKQKLQVVVGVGSVKTLDTFVKIKESASDLPTLEEPKPFLFSGLVFYLSRETNVFILSAIIYSLGGQVGWDETTVERPSKYKENDPRITHHVVDRPQPKGLPTRTFVQPQWLFDCLNTNQLLLVSMKNGTGYAPGESLPPHLSPFAKSGPYEYHPDHVDQSLDQVPEKPLAHALMPKSHQKLYDNIHRTRRHKIARIQRLKRRREVIETLKSKLKEQLHS